MKKMMVFTIVFTLLVSTLAWAQCFRLSGCDGWPKDEPIFAHQMSGGDILFVAVFPEEVKSITVYWGGRDTSSYSAPLPVVLSHRYIESLGGIRVQAFDTAGNVFGGYTYQVELD